MRTSISLILRAIALLVWILPTSVWAASPVALSPTAVLGTDLGTYNSTVAPEKMIDQSGLQNPFVSGVTLFDTYFANPAQNFATSGNGGIYNWNSELLSSLTPNGYIDFDLGATYTINKLGIWNRSIKRIQIGVQENLNDPEQVAGSFSLIDRSSFPFSYASEVLTFSQPLKGRYVRFTIESVYPIPGFSFGYAIIGEVVFSVIPETPVVPTIKITRDSAGDVDIEFTGKLLQSTQANGPFSEVPGNPHDHYKIPKGLLLDQQFFRATN